MNAKEKIAGIDNPDQRIAQDVAQLVEDTMELTSGFIGALKGDPLTDVVALRAVHFVMNEGVVYRQQ